MKQCRECGTLSPDDTVFCYICGTRFPDPLSMEGDKTTEEDDDSKAYIQMSENEAESVKVNGLYYFIEGGFRYLIRFYPNGNVQGTSDTNTAIPSPREIQSIRYRDQGSYSIANSQLSFTLSNKQGQVDYWGHVFNGKLILSRHSHINGYQSSNEEYQFVQV